MTVIAVTDLSDELAGADHISLMLAGANGQAQRIAPCLFTAEPAPTEDQLAEARLVLLGAIVRWVQSGAGAVVQQSAGPFAVGTDTRQRTGYKLWPSEITQLQEICSTGSGSRGAFAIDTAPGISSAHLPWCDLMFMGTSCSCGVDIAGYPIYENVPR